GFSSSGVTIFTVPTCEANGHAAGSAGSTVEPRPNWALLHASKPSATEGSTVIPSGSVTVAFFSSGVALTPASLVCGTFKANVAPVGSSAWVVPPSETGFGLNSTSGWNWSWSQPVTNDSVTLGEPATSLVPVYTVFDA